MKKEEEEVEGEAEEEKGENEKQGHICAKHFSLVVDQKNYFKSRDERMDGWTYQSTE